MRIGLSVAYPSLPDDEKDIWRIARYLEAIEIGGGEGTPLYLDEWETRPEAAVSSFDGLILSGGADLPTEWYGQEPLPDANLDFVAPRRPNFEKTLVDHFIAAQKPVFGICYGLQFLNVHQGGGLYQDLKLQTGTDRTHTGGELHVVRVEPDSQLFAIVGETEFEVPSFHHQGVSKVAPDGRATAFSEDGVVDIVEAVEWKFQPFFMGVQWHPERAPESNATQKLMKAFVAACQDRAR